jgi:hypothetical protein
MAKCSLCMKTKGKRKCLLVDGTVCTQCCGTSRSQIQCEACPHFKAGGGARRYSQVPYFTTHEMAGYEPLADAADVIEGAIHNFDKLQNWKTGDALYVTLMECLIDRYHFGDENLEFADDLEAEGFDFLESAIKKNLDDAPDEILVKVIGAVYRSIKRRTRGSREYLDFISEFVLAPMPGPFRRISRE